MLKKHYVLEVGDGSTIKIQRDNWIPGIQGPQTSPIITMNPSHVNQLIDSNTKTWKLKTLNAIFDQDIVSAITGIRIPVYGMINLGGNQLLMGSSLLNLLIKSFLMTI